VTRETIASPLFVHAAYEPVCRGAPQIATKLPARARQADASQADMPHAAKQLNLFDF
jgi:hypothetical protein